jgi:hypothetical protein
MAAWRSALFRFGAAYWVLFILPFPLAYVPYVGVVGEAYLAARDAVVRWVAAALHVALPDAPTRGSGDGTSNYVWLLCNVVLALAIGAAWTAAAARRPPADRTKAALQILLRYFLAATMLGYGAVKVYKSQFPALAPSNLETTYGESSPMGLLWRFMSHSTPYSVFAGVLEVAGALLLFHRRTTALGALVLAAVLTNVVMLNLCFDVPVKIFSGHLLLLSIVILAPQARALFRLFVLGKAAELAAPLGLSLGTRRARVAHGVAKTIVILGLLAGNGVASAEAYATWGDGRALLPLEGIWEVVDIEHGGASRTDAAMPPPLRWRRVTIDHQGFVTFDTDGKRRRWENDYDAERRSLRLREKSGGTLATEDGGAVADTEWLELRGEVDGKPARVTMRRVHDSEVVLRSRGFHWVNEQPFWR